ncbi:MAG TPA: hypothetical protein VNI02_09865 [Blastocatellia bacterium]|nr:hypothetical protein [Blastocatellia bacterium]
MLRLVIKVDTLLAFVIFCSSCNAPAPTLLPANSNGSARQTTSPQAGSSQSGPAQSGSAQSGNLQFKSPDGWVAEQPAGTMRVAQYKLPRAEGDTTDAALAVFYFGQGQGGSVEANLDRWVGQMQQPDGSSSKSKAKTETTSVNGMPVTLLDVTGTYTESMMGGAGGQQIQGPARMRAAVIETPRGAYYVKLVGPEKTVSRWDASFMGFIKSAEFK